MNKFLNFTKKLILIVVLVLAIQPVVFSKGIYQKNGLYGYNGQYYSGFNIQGFFGDDLIDTVKEKTYKIPAKYSKIEPLTNLIANNEYVIVTAQNGKKGVFKNGRIFAPIGKYNNIEIVRYKKRGENYIYLKTEKAGKYGAILPYIPAVYDNLEFKDGYAITELNGKKGLYLGYGFDDKPEHKFDEEFDEIKVQKINLYILTKNGKTGVYGANSLILPFEYEYIDPNRGIVKKNGLYGKYDKDFTKLVLPIQYQKVEFFEEDEHYDLYFITQNNKVGLMRDDGNTARVIIEPKYDEIFKHPANTKRFVTKKDKKHGMVEYNYSYDFNYDEVKTIIPTD